MKAEVLGWLFIFCFCLVACHSQPDGLTAAPMTNTTTYTLVAQATFLNTPTLLPATRVALPAPSSMLTATPWPTRWPTRTPTRKPTKNPTATATLTATALPLMPPPAGLVYTSDRGVWRVNAQGTPKLIIQMASGDEAIMLAPDLKHAIAVTESTTWGVMWDFWIIDLATGERTSLEMVPNYVVCGLCLWPERSNYLLVNLQPVSEAGGMYCEAVPAIFSINGKFRRFVGDWPDTNSSVDLSSDGKTIAYSQGGTPWLYDWDSGSREFDLSSYGFPTLTHDYVWHPSWSPGGKKLAWTVYGELNGEYQGGVGIFDLEKRTSIFLHPYQIGGDDGEGSYIYWSPEEQYIVLDNSTRELRWLLAIDGSSAKPIDAVPHWDNRGRWSAYDQVIPVTKWQYERNMIIADPMMDQQIVVFESSWFERWSPDGEWLLLNHRSLDGDFLDYWLVKTGTWQVYRLDIPIGAEVEGWMP